MSEPSTVTSTMMLQYMVNHHPAVLNAANTGNRNLQLNLLVGNNAIPDIFQTLQLLAKICGNN